MPYSKILFLLNLFHTATSMISQTHELPFRTCLTFGKSYYRTFDGLEYQYDGECTYTLAENPLQGWHVENSMTHCETVTTCAKVRISSQ